MKKITILILILINHASISQCLSGDCYSGYGKYNYPSGNKYEGEFLYATPNGKGTAYYKNGEKYEGDWVNNSKQGKGTFIYVSGGKYEGDWVNDVWQGYGKYNYPSGSTYEGNWVNNIRQGYGVFLSKGDKYEGEWIADTFTGKGKVTYSTGEVKEGQWNRGVLFSSYNTTSISNSSDNKGNNTPSENLNITTSDYDFGINNISFSYSGNTNNNEFDVKKQILGYSLLYTSVNLLNHVDITQTELKKKELARMCELLYKKLLIEFKISKEEILNMYFSPEDFHIYNKSTVPELYAMVAEGIINGPFFNKSVNNELPIKVDGVPLNNNKKNNTTSNKNTSSTSSCNISFAKPQLILKWVDNRKMCCYCRKRYARYEVNTYGKDVQEMSFLGEKLYMHFKAVNADDDHKAKDQAKLSAFVAKNYNPLSAMGMGMATGFAQAMEILGVKLGNKNKEVDKYTKRSEFCSDECEDRCSWHEKCKCR